MYARRANLTRSRLMAALAVAAVAAGACSSSNGGSSGSAVQGGSSAQASAASQSSQTQDQLATAAKKEGKLTDYDAGAASSAAAFVAAFEKDNPGISVNDVRLSAADIPTRAFIEEKAGKYLGDVAGASGSYMTELRLGGGTQPYTPPDQPPIPKGLNLPEGYQTVDSVNTETIAYNPKQLKAHNIPVPTSWQDFTNPAWKGHFSLDPEALDWYTGLIAEYGHDKALNLVKALAKNDPVSVTSHTQAVVQVESGSPWATVTTYGYIAEKFTKKDPQNVAFVNFNPLMTDVDLIYMMKNAPHPAAAKLFINWDLSQAGQQAMVDIVGLQSLRSDVKQDTNVWNPAKWTPVFVDPNLTTDQLATYQKEFAAALKGS